MNHITRFDVEAMWEGFVRTGEAVLALRKARDSILLAHGNTLAGASFHLLLETATGLLIEQGRQLRALATHPDPAVREFVQGCLIALHGPEKGEQVEAHEEEKSRSDYE